MDLHISTVTKGGCFSKTHDNISNGNFFLYLNKEVSISNFKLYLEKLEGSEPV